MLIIGANDAFEQKYMAKFEQLASVHGVFVKYDRDRAARDIGLHLTQKLRSSKHRVSGAVVWFQMKGVMSTTVSEEQLSRDGGVRVSLSVEHLRHWYLEKEPTHLAVYVEAIDSFLVTNLQAYITSTWGRGILELDQKTATIFVSTSSHLDEQAFSILLRDAEIAQWVKALEIDQSVAQQLHRDYDLIYAMGSADDRGMKHAIVWTKWLSKMRHELEFVELPQSSDEAFEIEGVTLHEHWEFGGIEIPDSYPYLEFFSVDEYEPETFVNRWGEVELEEDGELYTLPNGEEVFGPNAANEYCEFVIGARLNKQGEALYKYVTALVRMGLLELRPSDEDTRTFLSIAPWHGRDV